MNINVLRGKSYCVGQLGLVLAVVAGTVWAQVQAPRPASYTVTDLGTLGGPGTNSTGFDMNNAGWVAGSGNLIPGGPQHAFLWYGRGPLIDLGTLGGPNSEPGGPNARGEASVLSETSEVDPNGEDFCGFGNHLQCLAGIWRNRQLTALRTLPGGRNAQAYGLNNRGQVIGFSEDGFPDSSCSSGMPFQVFHYQAVIWEPTGEPRKLDHLPGDTVGFAFGINDRGQAIGASGLCSNTTLPPNYIPNAPHAVLWERDGSPIDLGALEGAPFNFAVNINNRGEVTGNSQFPDGNVRPFLWTKTTGMQDLGAFSKGAFATVTTCCDTINNKGQIVGFSVDAQGMHGFLWQDNVFTDLNDLIPKDSPWQLQFPLSINDAGEITGQGLIDGELHAFLATPGDRSHATEDTASEGPRVVSPENARTLLQLQPRFGRFGVRLIRPQ